MGPIPKTTHHTDKDAKSQTEHKQDSEKLCFQVSAYAGNYHSSKEKNKPVWSQRRKEKMESKMPGDRYLIWYSYVLKNRRRKFAERLTTTAKRVLNTKCEIPVAFFT